MDGRLIRLFLEVYERNSVSRAADQLGLTQSTVSHGLERLRKSLDDPLFVKDGRNITPTPHADYLAPRMREALSAIEALTEPQDYDPSSDRHPITIAANAGELQPELSYLGRALRAAAPHIPVRFVNLGSSSNARPVLENARADLVIAVNRGNYSPDLDHAPFFADHQATFYDPNVRGPVETLEDFGNARHAAMDLGGGKPSVLEEYLNAVGVSRNIVLHASSLSFLAELMRGTDMVATMQSRFADTAFTGFAVSQVPIDLPPIQYDLVWHRRQSLSKRHIWLRGIALRAPVVGRGTQAA
ncbi:MAG: LysR family transcriptional regulator [Pseudomonadota bacterium]